MALRRSLAENVFEACNACFLAVVVVVTLYPMLYIVFGSLSKASRLVGHTGLLLHPMGFTLKAFSMVFRNPNILSGYRTTLLIVVLGTACNLLMTSLGAYVLSRRSFPLGKPLMMGIVFTMYFSGGLIPRYLLIYRTLGLGNSLLALVLPTAMATWNLLIMRTYFQGIPESIEESAKIDGANDFHVLFLVILPLSMPVVAVMVLYYGVGHWNAWFDAMVFIRDRTLYPLQLILREILVLSSMDSMGSGGADVEDLGENLKYATIVTATLPVLLAYPFIQKYFVKGIMIGAVKG
jgi:putative aldouronate transport system permease protein